MPHSRRTSSRTRFRHRVLFVAIVAAVVCVSLLSYYFISRSETSSRPQEKPIILYVNQGNGVVNTSNFGNLISFSKSKGFNTIFFQVYRSGVLLFPSSNLSYFVTSAHSAGLRIFFALYFTNISQSLPQQIYSDGEDGISLDMSALPTANEFSLLSSLSVNYIGITAVTSTNFTTALKPDWLVLETYGDSYQQYIHPGIIASVGVFTTSSEQQYQQEFQYALSNSDGVMVFDYAGLYRSGY
jgi:hypothetical protein